MHCDDPPLAVVLPCVYHVIPIWFACQPAVKSTEPSVAPSNTVLLQFAVDVFELIVVVDIAGKLKIENTDIKQIVRICFGLSNKLHVCVCVCVDFCGFQRVVTFFIPFLIPAFYHIMKF